VAEQYNVTVIYCGFTILLPLLGRADEAIE
jgi:hypothetical protein